MTNRKPATTQCAARSWCDVPGVSHDGDHDGEAGLPRMIATADPSRFRSEDYGVVVPEVVVRLAEQRASQRRPRFSLPLSLIVNEEEHATARLTVEEARLLSVRLAELVALADSEVEK